MLDLLDFDRQRFFWGAGLGFVAGGISTVLDMQQMVKQYQKNNDTLFAAYLVRGSLLGISTLTGFAAALASSTTWLSFTAENIKRPFFRFILGGLSKVANWSAKDAARLLLSRTNLALFLLVISIDIYLYFWDDSALIKWYESCYFSKILTGKPPKYFQVEQELTALLNAIQERRV